jgi:hypothetical protein
MFMSPTWHSLQASIATRSATPPPSGCRDGCAALREPQLGKCTLTPHRRSAFFAVAAHHHASAISV